MGLSRACAPKQPGNLHPRGGKKERALPIHLNSHAVGPSSSCPQPLNIAFETPCAAIIVLFFFLFSSSVQIGFRVYQVSIVMCNLLGQPNVAAAHKASNLAFSICPFEGLKRSDAKT